MVRESVFRLPPDTLVRVQLGGVHRQELEPEPRHAAAELLHQVRTVHAQPIPDQDDVPAQTAKQVAKEPYGFDVRAKMVFRHSSERRPVTPMEPGLQGHLFLADIAAEAERLAEAHRVVASVEVPAHTRTVRKCRGEFPAHLPLVRTVCESEDEDRVCACAASSRRSAKRPRAPQWLSFQREGGGKTAAILMSLLMTAKAAGIHPGDCFRDVLLRISTCTDVKQLTPHGWKQHFEAEVAGRRRALIEQIVTTG